MKGFIISGWLSVLALPLPASNRQAASSGTEPGALEPAGSASVQKSGPPIGNKGHIVVAVQTAPGAHTRNDVEATWILLNLQRDSFKLSVKTGG
jgi:hypothetical protein